MNIYAYLEPVLKNLIAKLSESFEKFTNFYCHDVMHVRKEGQIVNKTVTNRQFGFFLYATIFFLLNIYQKK